MAFAAKLKALPASQKRAWVHLAPTKEFGLCLYGGTALALRYGHRQSVDFDFFSAEPLDKALLARQISFLAGGAVIQESSNSLVVLAVPPGGRREVKLSFFGGLAFGRVGAPELTSDGVLLVASVRDLMATKLKVLFDRVEVKDYLDIAEMIARGADLAGGIRDAMALFPNLSPILCLKALCHFGDKGLRPLSLERRRILAAAADRVFQAEPEFVASKTVAKALVLSKTELAEEMARARSAFP